MPVQLAQRRINVDEYLKMAEAGILSGDDRVELINGQILEMSPIGSKHAACVDKISALLHELIPSDMAIIRVQNPVRLNKFSEPEPDISILKPAPDYYAESHPEAKDILMVIEVADTSLDYDKEIKLPLYAEAGIPEYWIVNLEKREIEAYRDPVNNGYLKMERFLSDSKVSSISLNLHCPAAHLLI